MPRTLSSIASRFCIAKKSGEEGDQLIRLTIMLPTGTAATRLEKFAETLDDEPALRSKLGE